MFVRKSKRNQPSDPPSSLTIKVCVAAAVNRVIPPLKQLPTMHHDVEDHVDENSPPALSPALSPVAVPVGTPLDWPIVDSDGTLLFASGTILATTHERDFLFDNFRPQRGDLPDTAGQAPTDSASRPIRAVRRHSGTCIWK